MFDIGMSELILIFVIALIVFGPKKLPEIGKSIGRALYEFKRATNEFKNNIENEVGTANIKEELLKQQKDIQTSLTAAAAIATEEKHKVEDAYATAAQAEKPSTDKEEPKTSHEG